MTDVGIYQSSSRKCLFQFGSKIDQNLAEFQRRFMVEIGVYHCCFATTYFWPWFSIEILPGNLLHAFNRKMAYVISISISSRSWIDQRWRVTLILGDGKLVTVQKAIVPESLDLSEYSTGSWQEVAWTRQLSMKILCRKKKKIGRQDGDQIST